MEVEYWDSSEQVLHVRISSGILAAPLFLSVVYGKCCREDRLPLWDKLREIAVQMESLPWLSEEERQGAKSKRTREMLDFANAINGCQLLDLETDGANFTWARGSTLEKLDRALIGEG